MVDVVLVQPPDPLPEKIIRDHAGKFGIPIEGNYVLLPPLDLAYAAAVLEKNGYKPKIIDSPALDLNTNDLTNKISNYNPALIVLNCAGISIKQDLKVSGKIKEEINDTKLVAVGPYTSMAEKQAFENEVDFVVEGEFDYTILELMQCIECDRIEEIRGVAYKKDGEVRHTPKRHLISNLDDLPFPAYHLLPMGRYHYPRLKSPFITMLTSRGCPYGCVYCPYPIGYGDVWRGRSPNNVITELNYLVEQYGIKSIGFRDQIFTFNMKRSETICDLIVEHGLDIGWRCETRVDKLNFQLMEKMKKAGCEGIHLGVESGDPQVLKKLAKTGVAIQKIKRVFKDAKKLGIETMAFFMIGLPGETRKSIWSSYKLARELEPDQTQFNFVMPYPGTKLYDMAQKEEWLIEGDFTKYDCHHVVMRTDKLTTEEISFAYQIINRLIKSKIPDRLAPLLLKTPLWGVYNTLERRFTEPKTKLLRDWCFEKG